MPCISFEFPKIEIPDLFVTLPIAPALPLPVDFTFCCKFEVPDILGVNAAVAVINAAVQAIGGEANSIIAMGMAEVLAAAQPVLELAVSISLDCPID